MVLGKLVMMWVGACVDLDSSFVASACAVIGSSLMHHAHIGPTSLTEFCQFFGRSFFFVLKVPICKYGWFSVWARLEFELASQVRIELKE